MAFLLRREHHRARGTVAMVAAMIAVILLMVVLVGATVNMCAAPQYQDTGG